jgi:hypothetical protein
VDEVYSVTLRKKQYERLEELQIDLGDFMDGYYCRRADQGYELEGNGQKIRYLAGEDIKVPTCQFVSTS